MQLKKRSRTHRTRALFEALEDRRLLAWGFWPDHVDLDAAVTKYPGIRGQGEVVVDIGTGINMAANDFNGRLWTNPGEIANNGIDDDNDGYVDNVHGWNYLGSNENGDISDVQGHGTGTAGLIVGNHYTWTSGDFPDGKEYE